MNPNHQRCQVVEEVSSIFSVRRTVLCKKYGLISNEVQKSLPRAFGDPLLNGGGMYPPADPFVTLSYIDLAICFRLFA